MPSRFDNLQARVHTTVRQTFGYPATWNSNDGLITWEGTVLLTNPTEREDVAGMKYDPTNIRVEYYEGQLPGLYERIRGDIGGDQITDERITVDGRLYLVSEVNRIADGKTYRASVTALE